MIHIHDVIIIESQGYNNFQLFHLGKITRNYYTRVTLKVECLYIEVKHFCFITFLVSRCKLV